MLKILMKNLRPTPNWARFQAEMRKAITKNAYVQIDEWKTKLGGADRIVLVITPRDEPVVEGEFPIEVDLDLANPGTSRSRYDAKTAGEAMKNLYVEKTWVDERESHRHIRVYIAAAPAGDEPDETGGVDRDDVIDLGDVNDVADLGGVLNEDDGLTVDERFDDFLDVTVIKRRRGILAMEVIWERWAAMHDASVNARQIGGITRASLARRFRKRFKAPAARRGRVNGRVQRFWIGYDVTD